jgi:phage shock protein C
MVDPGKPITRSRRARMVAGVCGGIAEWLGWDPSVVRVLYILVTVFTGFVLGLAAYVVLWFFLPESESETK